MKTWLSKYFGFSKGEFNGILLLIVFIICIKLTPLFLDFFKKDDQSDVITSAVIQKIVWSDKDAVQNEAKTFSHTYENSKLFKFDPNTLNLSAWQSLGLSKKQAQSILNYVQKGGKFYKPSDLSKMYAINEAMYQRLLPYINIQHETLPEKVGIAHPISANKFKNTPVIIDVNRADSTQLESIKGIGPAFAKRILKYRNQLGGFYKKEQLLEVYGLDSIKFKEIKDQIFVDTKAINKIPINTINFSEFKRFPYLSYKQMNAIINYRQQHGPYSSADDLKKIVILKPELVDKISIYILF